MHLYPCFDLQKTLDAAWTNLFKNLQSVSPEAPQDTALLLCLSERWDCHFFRHISELKGSWRVTATPEEGQSVLLEDSQGRKLVLLAGRQVETAEKVELLALGADLEIPDGESFARGWEYIKDSNAIAGLNWAPGKWMFRRRKVVEQILKQATPETLVICDSSLRPPLWPEPLLMKESRERGLQVIAGSDPLPRRNESALVGSYGVWIGETLNCKAPAAQLRQLLLKQSGKIQLCGHRSSTREAAWRIGNQMLKKRLA